MIDPRFTLTQHAENNYLYHLRFSVVLPPERFYVTQTGWIIEQCKEQYPELEFSFDNHYDAKFPDGQYADCVQCKIKNSYLEELVFSLPLELDTIMAATCGFKKAVPSLQFTVHPEELSTISPEDFLCIVSNMYADIGLSIEVRAVSWEFDRVVSREAVYRITPTDYDFI